MKICLAQYDIMWESKADNMQKVEAFFGAASEQRAELLIFPELSLTGFTMDTSLAEVSEGQTCRFFSQLTQKYRIPCVFGYAEKTESGVYNRLAYVDINGTISVRYSKIHPFSYGGESECYLCGDTVQSFCCGGMEIGLTICYDLRFPEIYQQLSKKCSLIIVSANWPMQRRDHWLTLLKARAIENQCYVAGCNRTGNGGGLEYCGDSAVYSPDGTELSLADSGEKLLFADIFNKAVEDIRSGFSLKQDRRPDMYRNFYE